MPFQYQPNNVNRSGQILAAGLTNAITQTTSGLEDYFKQAKQAKDQNAAYDAMLKAYASDPSLGIDEKKIETMPLWQKRAAITGIETKQAMQDRQQAVQIFQQKQGQFQQGQQMFDQNQAARADTLGLLRDYFQRQQPQADIQAFNAGKGPRQMPGDDPRAALAAALGQHPAAVTAPDFSNVLGALRDVMPPQKQPQWTVDPTGRTVAIDPTGRVQWQPQERAEKAEVPDDFEPVFKKGPSGETLYQPAPGAPFRPYHQADPNKSWLPPGTKTETDEDGIIWAVKADGSRLKLGKATDPLVVALAQRLGLGAPGAAAKGAAGGGSPQPTAMVWDAAKGRYVMPQ